MSIPADLTERWRQARDELTRAIGSLAHPRPDDSFAEMSREASSAHDAIADLYQELSETPGVSEMVAEAAKITAEHHRAAASTERARDYAW